MKKLLSILGIISASAWFMTSCEPPRVDPENEVTDSIPKSIDNYLPATAGSWWLYNTSLGDQYKRSATGTDTMKGGLKMKYFTYTNMTSLDENPEYFNRFDEVNYYTLFTFDSAASDASYIPLVVMKDDPYVGMSWENMSAIIDDTYGEIEMKATCKVESLTDVIEIDDTTFTNVIKMKAKLEGTTSFISGWKDCGYITFWFVKRVGIVQQDYNIKISLAGATLFEKVHLDVLKAYHIEE